MAKPPASAAVEADKPPAGNGAQTTERSENASPQSWRRYLSLGLAAFILSITIALINVFYFLRGAEITVLAPEEVILFRDMGDGSGVLSFAVPVSMINGARDRGDVMLDAELRVFAGGPDFQFEAAVRPIYSNPHVPCESAATRCIALPGITIVESEDDLISVPGGAALARHLSFAMTPSRCLGEARDCARYAQLPLAGRTIARHRLSLRVRLNFHDDGQRIIECDVGILSREQRDWFRANGWVTLPCARSEVSGEPFF